MSLSMNTSEKNLKNREAYHWTHFEDLKAIDLSVFHSWMKQEYGLPDQEVDHTALFQNNLKTASLVPQDIILPPLNYNVAGLPTVNLHGRQLHFTSAGILKWGHLASLNFIELQSRDEVDQYFRREFLILNPLHLTSCTRGHCIIRYNGVALGSGFLRKGNELENGKPLGLDESDWVLISHYPKAFKLTKETSSFEMWKDKL